MVTRMIKAGCVGMVVVLGYSAGSFAQILTFNSPAPWLSLRNDSIVVKTQLDTSKFAQKKITLSVTKIENKQKKVIATKTFKVTDFTQDFALGLAGTSLLGGKDYLKIEWSVPGITDKGYCAPIGIVAADKINKIQPMHVAKASAAPDIKSIAGIVKDKQFLKVQNAEFLPLWDSSALWIVLKKTTLKDVVKFTFDGKNGKNAFVSYPDKMVDYVVEKDSLHTYINERSFADSILYNQKIWTNDVTKSSDKDYVMVKLPWYDLGIAKPFEGRIMGFAAFALAAKGSMVGFPDKATLYTPGSWGSLVLDK